MTRPTLLSALARRGATTKLPDWRRATTGDKKPSLPMAVHESAHALDLKLPTPWTDVVVDRALRALPIRQRVAREVTACAVGELVTEAVGDMTWPTIWRSALESIVSDFGFAYIDNFRARIDKAKATRKAQNLAARILRLAMKSGRA